MDNSSSCFDSLQHYMYNNSHVIEISTSFVAVSPFATTWRQCLAESKLMPHEHSIANLYTMIMFYPHHQQCRSDSHGVYLSHYIHSSVPVPLGDLTFNLSSTTHACFTRPPKISKHVHSETDKNIGAIHFSVINA